VEQVQAHRVKPAAAVVLQIPTSYVPVRITALSTFRSKNRPLIANPPLLRSKR
jgi:hypothetical protein